MKIPFPKQSVRGKPTRRQHALTIVEMLVAMSIFSMCAIGMVYVHLFGLRQDQLVQSKLGASDQSRRGFDLLQKDVREAKVWRIGNGSLNSFTTFTNGALQQGTGLKVQKTMDTNAWTIYYFDTSAGQLRRRKSGVSGSTVIAKNLTNVLGSMYFKGETYQGSNLYTLSHKAVVNVKMEFAQFQYPMTKVGPGYYYDYYKMEFRLTSHVPDGL